MMVSPKLVPRCNILKVSQNYVAIGEKNLSHGLEIDSYIPGHFLSFIHRLVQLDNQLHQLHCLVRFVNQYTKVDTNPCYKEHLVSLVQLLYKHLRIRNHQDQFHHIDTIFVQLGIAWGIQKQHYSIP